MPDEFHQSCDERHSAPRFPTVYTDLTPSDRHREEVFLGSLRTRSDISSCGLNSVSGNGGRLGDGGAYAERNGRCVILLLMRHCNSRFGRSLTLPKDANHMLGGVSGSVRFLRFPHASPACPVFRRAVNPFRFAVRWFQFHLCAMADFAYVAIGRIRRREFPHRKPFADPLDFPQFSN